MSRDRKFQAWDKESKKWLDISHLLLDYNGKVIGYTVGNDSWTIDKVELVEWTGKHDKNRVPIFEGDSILRYTAVGDRAEIGFVEWSDYNGWEICIRRGSHPLYIPDGREDEIYRESLYNWMSPSRSGSSFEVIGNKWETPVDSAGK